MPPTQVQLPDGSIAEFPEGMSDQEIESVIRGHIAGQDRPSQNIVEDIFSGFNRGLEMALGLPATAVEFLLNNPMSPAAGARKEFFQKAFGVDPTVRFPRPNLPTTAPTSATGEFIQRTGESVGGAAPFLAGGLALATQKFITGVATLGPAQLAALETALAGAGGAAAATFRQIWGKDHPFVEAAVELLSALGVSKMASLVGTVARAKTVRNAIFGAAPGEVESTIQTEVQKALPPGSPSRENIPGATALGEDLGVDLSLAQKTGSPTIKRAEQEFARMSPEAAEKVSSQQVGARRQLAGQLEGELGAGVEEGAGTVQDALRARDQALEAALDRRLNRAEQARDAALSSTQARLPREVAGGGARRVLIDEEMGFRQDAEVLFDQIDNGISVETRAMDDTAANIVERAKKLGDTEVPPIVRRVLRRKQAREAKALFEAQQDLAEGEKLDPANVVEEPETFGYLRTQRSLMLQEIRNEAAKPSPSARKLARLNEMVDAIEADLDTMLTDGNAPEEAVKAYRTAVNYYRPRAQLFKRGGVRSVLRKDAGGVFRVPNEKVPGKFLASGQDVSDYLKAVSSRAEIQIPEDASASVQERLAASQAQGVESRAAGIESMREFLLGDFVDKVTENGQVLAKRIPRFLEAHRAAFSMPEFRDLRARMGSVQRAQELVDSRLAFHKEVRAVKDAHAATLFLKSDPNVAMKQILALSNKGQATRQLVALVRGDQAALRGLRRAFAEETILSTIGPGETAADTFRNSSGLLKWLDSNREVISALYSREHAESLRKIAQGFQFLERSPAAAGARVIGAEAPLFTGSMIASRMFALRRGVVGKAFLASEAVARRASKMIAEHNAAHLEAVVGEVLFDPEFAKTIELSGSLPAKRLSMRIRAHVANLGRLTLQGEDPEANRPQRRKPVPSALPPTLERPPLPTAFPLQTPSPAPAISR